MMNNKIIPAIHRDIGINCASPVGQDFERVVLCFIINKYTRLNNWPSHIFQILFENPPANAILFTEVKLGSEILTHKIYFCNQIFYIIRNF